jgi:hypothetical protein
MEWLRNCKIRPFGASNAEFLLTASKFRRGFRWPVIVRSADKFTVGILALLAQRERELISERTRLGFGRSQGQGHQTWNIQILENALAAMVVANKAAKVEFAT